MKPTYTRELLWDLLGGVAGGRDIKKTNWTVHGSEAIIEYQGHFYRICIEPISKEKSA